MSSFWQGFEKQAFLKGVLKSDLFNKAVNAKYKNAIKNFEGDFSHQDSIVGAIKSLIKNPSMSNILALEPGAARGGHIGVNTSMAHMVTAKGLNKLRSAPPTLGAQMGHHELSEMAEMSRKGYDGEMFTPGIRDFLSPLRAKAARDAFRIAGKTPEYVAKLHGMYEKAPKFLQHPKVKHILGAAKEDSKSLPKIFDAVAKMPQVRSQVRLALLGKTQTGAHASPSILINESNKLFHEADPRAIEAMKNMRKTTGEAELLRRSGIRYGEEYVPENGRRFNKAVGRIRKENFK